MNPQPEPTTTESEQPLAEEQRPPLEEAMRQFDELEAALDWARQHGLHDMVVLSTFWYRFFGESLPERFGLDLVDAPLIKRCLEDRDPEPYYRQRQQRLRERIAEGWIA